VGGLTLAPALIGVNAEHGWVGTVAGEDWLFVQKAHKRWQGFTADHLTGTPINLSLGRVVAWVIEHESEWKAKLKVRRKAGTRMVDPVDKQRKCAVCGGLMGVGTHARCQTSGYEGLG
jgi:hypothetical protein